MFHWYVINTYSGHENKVKANLEHRIVSMNQQQRFRRVVVPTEQVIETKDGQKVQTEKRVLPGYVLVNMDLNDEAWTVVKGTPGVTAFVGAGAKPSPLSTGRGRPDPPRGRRSAARRRRGRRSSSRSASRSRSRPARSPTSTARSSTSTPTRRSSRCSSTSSSARCRSSSRSTRSRRSTNDRRRGGGAHAPHGTPMAKKVLTLIKLQIPGGQANPAPPVGPALGQHGVNIVEFTKAFNAQTAHENGRIIPVEITVFEDRSFTFITKTPPAAVLIKEALGLESGSAEPNRNKVGR